MKLLLPERKFMPNALAMFLICRGAASAPTSSAFDSRHTLAFLQFHKTAVRFMLHELLVLPNLHQSRPQSHSVIVAEVHFAMTRLRPSLARP